jgi:hypothetical protein
MILVEKHFHQRCCLIGDSALDLIVFAFAFVEAHHVDQRN